ncbi:glycosyl transferase family 28 [Salinarimonas soli]|uniref:Glycosyl transferase family 28 n=1 Tax=Salinarimonas soli TaxID=1638099 RepID=A0A5B2VHB3_9HYPH|nr:glycosyl transferase family 28 [Salinarimonas soli]
MSVAIAVTHLLGVGHLARAAAIGRALAQRGHAVTLVSGGMPAPLVDVTGLNLMQLPPVRVAGTAFTTLLAPDGTPADAARLEERRRILAETVRALAPDVLVTELFPFGRRVLADEFLATIDAARAARPDGLVLASVRDVLAAPGKPARVGQTHERVARLYDGVLVHGDPALLPLDRSWPVDETLRPRLIYTGYVADSRAAGTGGSRTGEILVSGGGSAASLPLYRAALGAAARVDRPWRILVGHGVDADSFAALRAAAPANAVVERARPDFPALLAGAALSVSQAGYNTAVDLLRTGTPAVLVPFAAGRETEQTLRAEALAAAGLAVSLAEADLSPETLAEAVTAALTRAPSPAPAIPLDGAERTARIVEDLARRPAAPAIRRPGHDWRPLDEALRRRADDGVPVAIWWRDDDAVAATPALERLLTTSRHLAWPVGLAVVPALLEPSLAEHLASEPEVDVLVHGLRHRNHAPAGAKKSEFGADRPLSALLRDTVRALRLTRAAFPHAVVPVFVPPWNRIDPALAQRCADLGFHAVSTFRRAAPHGPGLLPLETHLDPVDWRGGRGLVDPDHLIRGLAADIADAWTPLGVLTHHLAQDEATWAFVETLLDRLAASPAVIRTSARAVLRPAGERMLEAV